MPLSSSDLIAGYEHALFTPSSVDTTPQTPFTTPPSIDAELTPIYPSFTHSLDECRTPPEPSFEYVGDLPSTVSGMAAKLEDLLRPQEPHSAHTPPKQQAKAALTTAEKLYERVRSARRTTQLRHDRNLARIYGLTREIRQDLRQFLKEETRRGTLELGGLPSVDEATSAGTSPAKRGSRTFDLVPDPSIGKVTGRVTPKALPATLEVTSPSHGEVNIRFSGLGFFFPAHTVHAGNCTSVVEGNNCVFQSEDHYHVQHVTLSLQPLLESGPANAALQALAKNPSERGIKDFQHAMQRLADPPSEERDTQASLPVRANPLMVITGCRTVQQGDGSRTNVNTDYVLELSEIPIIEAFAQDPSLIRAFAEAAMQPEDGPAIDKFLDRSLTATGRVDEMTLLANSPDLEGPDTRVRALFGFDSVTDATGVVVGTGNQVITDMTVDRGSFAQSTVLDDFAQIRELFAREARKRRARAGLIPGTAATFRRID